MTLITIKEFLAEYAELKIQQKVAEARMKEIAPIITQAMIEQGVDKVPTTKGAFTLKNRKTWRYSEMVENMKEALDEGKAREEADGTATFTESQILEFRQTNE